ncbi:acetyltransferase-like protein [Leptotrombidium deliense]|uniref:arylamine N-acetyltransferase n=1 Tax=Leptotrombidium deliense TaxID=299467 RepID=A0A443S3A7_9ACAR|nr:acetyltransferase-like protein [Leptotrombidium deliense]
MDHKQVEQYLSRIDVAECDNKSYDFLATIQRNHVLNIDFSNLHMIAGKELRWQLSDAFEDILLKRCGGVCFELNNLMYLLLLSLNFDVILMAAPHVRRRGDTTVDHAACLVKIDGCQYLVDVADGYYSSRIPVNLNGDVVEDINFSYKVANDGHKYTLKVKENDEWNDRYTFNLKPKTIGYFQNEFIGSTTEKFFNENVFLVNTTTVDKRILFEKRFICFNGKEKRAKDIDENCLQEIIRTHFDVPENLIPTHFPKILP